MLADILRRLPQQAAYPALLVGHETGDDAAVFRISDDQAVVATTDFFTPIVDDAYDFGRIAATNALSDVYAVGGRPIVALAVAGFPLAKMSVENVRDVMAGGAAVCAAAGVPVAGGHTIDAPEPIYGLAVVGLVHPDRIKRNSTARAGDALILGKGLGIGILSAAMKKGELDGDGYAQLVSTATKLNSVGADLAEMPGVHALTDITGFGLLGHLLEMCRGAGLGATIELKGMPVLPAARRYAREGYNTGAVARNWASFGGDVVLAAGIADWHKNLLADPQTSGGLLVACAANAVQDVLRAFYDQGYGDAATIGSVTTGLPRVTVR